MVCYYLCSMHIMAFTTSQIQLHVQIVFRRRHRRRHCLLHSFEHLFETRVKKK